MGTASYVDGNHMADDELEQLEQHHQQVFPGCTVQRPGIAGRW